MSKGRPRSNSAPARLNRSGGTKKRASGLRKNFGVTNPQQDRNKRIKDLQRVIKRGTLDIKKTPALLKTRIDGEIRDSLTMEHPNVQSFIWTDKAGRKMLIKRKENNSDLATDFDEIAEAMMNQDIGGLKDSPPLILIIELGPGDSREAFESKLRSLERPLAQGIEFVGGGKQGQFYLKWRDILEDLSEGRFNNDSYLEILRLLEMAITLENEADTLDNVDVLFNITNQIIDKTEDAKIKNIRENKEINILLDQLNKNLEEKRKSLREEYIKKSIAVKRTPIEVMVHLLHEVKMAIRDDDADTLEAIRNTVEDRILKHQLKLNETRKYLENIKLYLKEINESGLARLVEKLLSQLPDPAKGQFSEPTRLHDNVYGRILDSAIINNLVKDPPQAVKESMIYSARWLHNWITKTIKAESSKKKEWEKVAVELQYALQEWDVRFWFSKTPALMKVRDATTDEGAYDALMAFLNDPGSNGQEMVAIPYALMKLSIATMSLGNDDSFAPWLDGTGITYDIISSNRGRTDVPSTDLPEETFHFESVEEKESRISGITLGHQLKEGMEDASLNQSTRPALRNIPIFNPAGGALADSFDEFPVTQTALEHGLPFASGISGSTNAMLYYLNHLNTKGGMNIDTKAFLLGNLMFMVYDGGHSLQEVLWATNLVDRHLQMGIELSRPEEDIKDFVADYTLLMQRFGDTEIGRDLQKAIYTALDETTSHFAQHSIHSEDR